ncbi:hypothetical protein [Actinophytocola sediminis]
MADMTLDELITALIELRDEPDSIEACRRCPDLSRAAQGVIARTRVERMEQALDLPRMTKVKLAAALGVLPNKVYRRRAQHRPKPQA